ncbi:hypothetical protein Desor_2843 [Desulfosporosinus orientis DSM 765]|uniref:Uncharacterized protein n=1 Tax=Desulfosporosinus orientis (strain ATCC 19365 / DSM 765 / NCIMB 8382 / VKM B-1628 / Singapore I) TaxID=768706 RepID=G7WDQ0_DESOD|nr:hypothetical protein [Desulfosporosinus orientis]AET68375.1 hypothetical protein Desor_2843 [Desulfosporosinus orientis DSM 765]
MPEQNQMLTPQETIELHELISMKIMEKKKLKATKATIQDNGDLSSFIDDAIKTKEQQIDELKQFISSSIMQ